MKANHSVSYGEMLMNMQTVMEREVRGETGDPRVHAFTLISEADRGDTKPWRGETSVAQNNDEDEEPRGTNRTRVHRNLESRQKQL